MSKLSIDHAEVMLSLESHNRKTLTRNGMDKMACDILTMLSNAFSIQWRHNERDGVSNHQPCYCLLNRLFRRRSKKTSNLRVTGLCAGNSSVTVEFPTQRPVTRKQFPFDDVIMSWEKIFPCCFKFHRRLFPSVSQVTLAQVMAWHRTKGKPL